LPETVASAGSERNFDRKRDLFLSPEREPGILRSAAGRAGFFQVDEKKSEKNLLLIVGKSDLPFPGIG
jgi:hypothetical protein